jgi:hypothetical protein
MTQWHPQSIPPSRLVREKTFALRLTRSPRSRSPLMRTVPLISSTNSGDVKGTIRIDLRYRLTPNDVRRHRLISISYISLLPYYAGGRGFESEVNYLVFPPNDLSISYPCLAETLRSPSSPRRDHAAKGIFASSRQRDFSLARHRPMPWPRVGDPRFAEVAKGMSKETGDHPVSVASYKKLHRSCKSCYKKIAILMGKSSIDSEGLEKSV